jgi:hypothetical protein
VLPLSTSTTKPSASAGMGVIVAVGGGVKTSAGMTRVLTGEGATVGLGVGSSRVDWPALPPETPPGGVL